MKRIVSYIRIKKFQIIAALAGAFVLAYILFPIVAALVRDPYVITLRYKVQTEAIYTLKFDHYIFVDPSTTFVSSADDPVNVSIKNVRQVPITCWISNYAFTAPEYLLNYYQPVLDQQTGPNRLEPVWGEEQLGALLQPYRSVHLEPGEAIEVSFHGHKRTVDCPASTQGRPLLFEIDGKSYAPVFSSESSQFDILNENVNKQKTTTVIIPAFAFGKYEVDGPRGFELVDASVKNLGNNSKIPYGSIAFPYTALITSLTVSLFIISFAAYLIHHFILLVKRYSVNDSPARQAIPLFSNTDFLFLFISGILILTFTGSVPPIHMLDSVYYVDTASELRRLFSTFMYLPYRNPGYMIFIWLAKRLMGPGYGLILVQQALFFVTIFLVYKTVEHFTRGNRFLAWITASLYLLNPINLIFSQFIQPEGLWRDLIVLWAFSLVLLSRQHRYASACGGIALGLLWLSRSSALPSIILMLCVSLLIAWRNVSVKRHLIITATIIVLLYSPYFIYLRLAGTKSMSYFTAFHHSLSFLLFERTLDPTTACFQDSRLDLIQFSLEELPSVLTPLNDNDPTVNEAVAKATQFEKCVYQANYLRFPKQQLTKLVDRTLKYIWSPELRDRDLWDYSQIYSLQFITPEIAHEFSASGPFQPYFYAEKWNAQDAPSVWKSVFNLLYALWPYVNLFIVVFSFLSVLFLHYQARKGENHLFREVLPVSTSFVLLFLADAILYSVFGVVFPVRMMVAVSPLLVLAFGINMGVIIDWIIGKNRVTSSPS